MRHVARIRGKKGNLSAASVGKPEGKTLLSTLGRRWEKVLKFIKAEAVRIL